MEAKIRAIVYEALEELNTYRSSEGPLEINDSLILFGSGSPLDSLDLVSVITDVEEKLNDELSGKTFFFLLSALNAISLYNGVL